MSYTYLIEQKATPNLLVKDVFDGETTILYLLCYHIQTETKYPFIQFLLNKVPQCSIIDEQFILPFMFNTVNNQNDSLDELVLNKVKIELANMNFYTNKITNDMYKGIIFHKGDAYALVNITGIDITGSLFSRDILSWFALPTEIINEKKVCEIKVEQEVVLQEVDLMRRHHHPATVRVKYIRALSKKNYPNSRLILMQSVFF